MIMANFQELYENPQEFSKLLPSFLPRISRVFEDTLNLILKASRCSHSRKPSKFENENENPRGFEVSLTALVPTLWVQPSVLIHKTALDQHWESDKSLNDF